MTVTAPPEVRFLRGDADGDSRAMTIGDAVAIIQARCEHNREREPLACPDAADVDDNGAIEFDDAIYILKYRFCGTVPPPPPPFPECGEDPTADDLPECSYDDSLCGGVTVAAAAKSPKERRKARRQRRRGRRV